MALQREASRLQPFFSTPAQRLSLGRERFFNHGERPSGLVSEAVIQSWYRCVQSGRDAHKQTSVQTLSKLRIDAAMRRSRPLREASARGLQRLEAALAGTHCRVILTNADGVVIDAGRHVAPPETARHQDVVRIGLDMSEHAVGTSAPGIVVQTGQGCVVHGAEHFHEEVTSMECAAAPIRDIHGQLAGVLNISIEGRAFGFDAFALVGSYAGMIERHLVASQAHGLVMLRLHVDARALGTPLAGLAAFHVDGRLQWLNDAAMRLTNARPGQCAQEAMGHAMSVLLSLAHQQLPQRLCLPNGLHVWALGRLQGSSAPPLPRASGAPSNPEVGEVVRAWATSPLVSVPAAATSTLQESQDTSIARALQECAGNVARAARVLGVSRGVVYRHLRREKPAP